MNAWDAIQTLVLDTKYFCGQYWQAKKLLRSERIEKEKSAVLKRGFCSVNRDVSCYSGSFSIRSIIIVAVEVVLVVFYGLNNGC